MQSTDWLIVDFSIEEKLLIERRVRSVVNHDDSNEVAKLCAQLIRQAAFQERLLSQATAHIANLELRDFVKQSHRARTRRWWKPF
jgi:uncharacterized protein with PIN domain